ncbi:hypothetical protein F887_01923 [Acinetobacter sp. NIPH 2100]|nr:hypothetical protein F887_01923 [Acinetobacter sp. NIPH 2100]
MHNSGNKKALTKLAGIKGLSIVITWSNKQHEQYGTDRK